MSGEDNHASTRNLPVQQYLLLKAGFCHQGWKKCAKIFSKSKCNKALKISLKISVQKKFLLINEFYQRRFGLFIA